MLLLLLFLKLKQPETDGLVMNCFETYASLVRWIFKRPNGEEQRAYDQLLPLCYAGASKLIGTLTNKETSRETFTAAAHLFG